MAKTNTQNTSDPKTNQFSNTFKQLQVVVLAAFALATLFTAWTPGNALDQEGQNLLEILQQATIQPTAKDQGGIQPSNLVPAPPGREQRIIGIVVGHWGDNNDPGAICEDGQLTELTVNQNIASQAENLLVNMGFQVVLLREFDDRLRDFQGETLISLHADSCQYINDLATGFKVAAAIGSPNPEHAARLAACLRNRYAQATGLPLHSTSVTPDMTSYHAFGEINPVTPAVIIETGFLNLDRQFLSQKPDLAAKGIVDGILCFLNNETITSQ